jgi:hypothetical protein
MAFTYSELIVILRNEESSSIENFPLHNSNILVNTTYRADSS